MDKKTETVFSEHIFYYPFRWECKTRKDNGRLTVEEISDIGKLCRFNWHRVTPDTMDKVALYDKKAYYYDFCHATLFDYGTDTDDMRQLIHPDVDRCFYVIHCRHAVYRLPVTAIRLNLYATGIGILSIHVRNGCYSLPDDILHINQYGRRIFPPFYEDKNLHIELAHRLGLEGPAFGKDWIEDFQGYSHSDFNRPASFIKRLIMHACPDIKINDNFTGTSSAGIDDRMFVMCWYRNPDLVAQFHPGHGNEPDESLALDNFMDADFWYRFIFVDNDCETCQNRDMKARLLDTATYKRWSRFGTLYGITRYSFMMLSNAGDNEAHLYQTMTTIYDKMVELVLLQRASLLKISADISALSAFRGKDTILLKKVTSIYRNFIKLTNLVLQPEVTAQEQGIEMYDMLRNQLRIEQSIAVVDKDITMLDGYMRVQKDRHSNYETRIFTVMGAIIAVLALSGQFLSVDWSTLKMSTAILCVGIPIVLIFGIWGMITRRKWWNIKN